MTEHPYKDFENTKLWHVLDSAISDLAANSDIVESTSRHYIIGYLAKQLTEQGLVDMSSRTGE